MLKRLGSHRNDQPTNSSRRSTTGDSPQGTYRLTERQLLYSHPSGKSKDDQAEAEKKYLERIKKWAAIEGKQEYDDSHHPDPSQNSLTGKRPLLINKREGRTGSPVFPIINEGDESKNPSIDGPKQKKRREGGTKKRKSNKKRKTSRRK